MPFPRGSLAPLRSRLDPVERAKEGQPSTLEQKGRRRTYSEEDEDVTLGLRGVDLEDGGNGRMEVVGFGLRSVEDVDGVATTGDCDVRSQSLARLEEKRKEELTSEDGSIVKVLGELGGVERGTGDEEAEVGAEASNVL